MSQDVFKESQFTWTVTIYTMYVGALIIAYLIFSAAGFLWGLISGLLIFGLVFYYKLDRDKRIYILTNESLTIEFGILNKTIRKVPLSKIQDVTLKQGFIQKQFNVGDLFIESAGESGGGQPIKDIIDPRKKMEQILDLVHKK